MQALDVVRVPSDGSTTTGGRDVTEAQPPGGPTVRRMLVGSQLRRLRTQRGLTREQAGEAIRA
ncbi:MAG TPA: hypothetical protein VFA45_22725, partial [Actinomycetes bacterium]|nr:hypothetical protein [Actinomycetes bacterium]